jgi:hypothetical protein
VAHADAADDFIETGWGGAPEGRVGRGGWRYDVTAWFTKCLDCAKREAAWTAAFGPDGVRFATAVRLLKIDGPATMDTLDAAGLPWSKDLADHPALGGLSFASWVGAAEHLPADSQYVPLGDETPPALAELTRRAASVARSPFSFLPPDKVAGLRRLANMNRDLLAHAGQTIEIAAADHSPALFARDPQTAKIPHGAQVRDGCGLCGIEAYAAPYGTPAGDVFAPAATDTSVLHTGGGLVPVAVLVCRACATLDPLNREPMHFGEGLVTEALLRAGALADGDWYAPGRLARLTYASRVMVARRSGWQPSTGPSSEGWAHLPHDADGALQRLEGQTQPDVLAVDHTAEREALAAALLASDADLARKVANGVQRTLEAARRVRTAAETHRLDLQTQKVALAERMAANRGAWRQTAASLVRAAERSGHAVKTAEAEDEPNDYPE